MASKAQSTVLSFEYFEYVGILQPSTWWPVPLHNYRCIKSLSILLFIRLYHYNRQIHPIWDKVIIMVGISLVLSLLFLCISSHIAFRVSLPSKYIFKKSIVSVNSRLFADKKDDIVQRRKKRRGKNTTTTEGAVLTESQQLQITSSSNPSTESLGKQIANTDGSNSLEDLFGLGTDQLRELMEQELPVPREDVSTGKVVKESDADKNKVFKLPDLGEFVRGSDASVSSSSSKSNNVPEQDVRVDRSNQEEYMRVLQLNPFADADDSKFTEEYDIFASIFGTGKLLGIPIPYLQQGHGMLLVISLLAALVYAPGNPLTEFPIEIRNFLKQGLINVYAINSVLAVRASFIAKSKNLPSTFWAVKTFLLGGLPFYELTQARDPTTFDPKEAAASKKRKARNNKAFGFQLHFNMVIMIFTVATKFSWLKIYSFLCFIVWQRALCVFRFGVHSSSVVRATVEIVPWHFVATLVRAERVALPLGWGPK